MTHLNATKVIIIKRLQIGSATLEELYDLCDVSRNGIKSMISRLRDQQFRILSESTGRSGNPRYTMLSGPQSLTGSFVCPQCKETVVIGNPAGHKDFCPFEGDPA